MMMHPDNSNMEKIQIIKELHNLSKTYTLLLRDLPFVTNLSKYYDLELVDPNYNKTSEQQDISTNRNNVDKEIIKQKVSERLRKMIDESALFNSEQKCNMGIIGPTDGEEKITDQVMEALQKQLNLTPSDILDSINNKDYQESVRRLKEIRED